MYGKNRPEQHRIDERGLNIFRSSLPNSKPFEMVFSEEHKDYGIDGQLQICVNNKHLGEFYKVQIKSKGEAKYIDGGKVLSFSLDLDSAYFLIEQVQDPTALIIIDTDTSKVFWFPIQTSIKAREALEKRLLETKAVNPSITVHINVKENLLAQNNYQGLYDYFKEAKLRLSKKEMLRLKTGKNLSAGIQHLNEVEEQMLQLPGFDCKFRKGIQLTPGTVFSLENQNGKQMDFVPNKEFKPELAPTIKLTAKFSTKLQDEQKKFEIFRKAVQDGTGSIELDSTNIDSFEVMVGTQVVDKKVSGEGMKISIGPTKTKQVVFIDNGKNELEHPVEIWVEDNTFIISSVLGQCMDLRLSFKLGDLFGKLSINLHKDLITSASHQFRLFEFIRNTKQLSINIYDNEGFKRKLFGGDLDASSIVSEDQYNFAKALAEIEQKTEVPIPFPLPDNLNIEDIQNVFWVHQILTKGKVIREITMNFTLKDTPPEDLEKDKFLLLKQCPPEIYLFGKPYVMPSFTQIISGKISDIKVPKGKDSRTYKIYVKEAEISIEKTS